MERMEIGKVINKAVIEQFTGLIKGKRKIAIIGHLNPDGDCIGATTAMAAFLDEYLPTEPEINIVVPTLPPDFLLFLDGKNRITAFSVEKEKSTRAVLEAELIICMDFNTLKRLDDLGKIVSEAGAPKIMIDHHPNPDTYAALTISTTEVSSASELTYWLLKEVLKGKMSKQVGSSLYVGMMTDTNNFANSVFASTFLMASELTALGVEREMLQFAVMNNYSESRTRLIGEMLLNKMVVYPEYKVAFMMLDKQTKAKFNYKEGDTEGLVNIPLTIKGIEISALFSESEDLIRVSLRSRSEFSVNAFARRFFNGGGHERAAGGRLYIKADTVQEYFEKALKEQFV